MNLFAIIYNLRFQDVLDILFLTGVVYHLYLWFWGTRAFKALVGLLALGLVYTITRSWGLFLTTWAFQVLWQVVVVLLIILFQSEIRQVLERVNPLQFTGLRAFSKKADWVPVFVKAVFSLARRQTGAMIILQRSDRMEEWLTGCTSLEGEPSPELLVSIFQKNSPLRDGALLIKRGRVDKVACQLPMNSGEGLSKGWGSRHTAALGVSKRCDAWVIVVSGERGEISLARGGEMTAVENPGELADLVQEGMAPPRRAGITGWERFRSLVLRRWPVKLGALGLVSIFWLLLAGQQNFEVTLKVPLEVKNVPVNLEILEPLNPELWITVRGLRKDASTLSSKNVHAQIDLSAAREGKMFFRITRDQVTLPDSRIDLVHIEPPQMEFSFKKTPVS